jgi:hypothetical protein
MRMRIMMAIMYCSVASELRARRVNGYRCIPRHWQVT